MKNIVFSIAVALLVSLVASEKLWTVCQSPFNEGFNRNGTYTGFLVEIDTDTGASTVRSSLDANTFTMMDYNCFYAAGLHHAPGNKLYLSFPTHNENSAAGGVTVRLFEQRFPNGLGYNFNAGFKDVDYTAGGAALTGDCGGALYSVDTSSGLLQALSQSNGLSQPIDISVPAISAECLGNNAADCNLYSFGVSPTNYPGDDSQTVFLTRQNVKAKTSFLRWAPLAGRSIVPEYDGFEISADGSRLYVLTPSATPAPPRESRDTRAKARGSICLTRGMKERSTEMTYNELYVFNADSLVLNKTVLITSPFFESCSGLTLATPATCRSCNSYTNVFGRDTKEEEEVVLAKRS